MAALFEERLNLPYSLCWHLASLGLNDETIADFLDPKLRTCLPDPYVMKDAEHAVNLIKDNKKVYNPLVYLVIMMLMAHAVRRYSGWC